MSSAEVAAVSVSAADFAESVYSEAVCTAVAAVVAAVLPEPLQAP